MKAKVIIQDGKSNIELTPENEFEQDLIEKLINGKYRLEADTYSKYSYGEHKDALIRLNMEKK